MDFKSLFRPAISHPDPSKEEHTQLTKRSKLKEPINSRAKKIEEAEFNKKSKPFVAPLNPTISNPKLYDPQARFQISRAEMSYRPQSHSLVLNNPKLGPSLFKAEQLFQYFSFKNNSGSRFGNKKVPVNGFEMLG